MSTTEEEPEPIVDPCGRTGLLYSTVRQLAQREVD